MTRRPGFTLTEVVVTLAILAFGLLALLTMFPLAASYQAIALREDRSVQCAVNADGYLRSNWKAEIVDKLSDGTGVSEPYFDALRNPNASPGIPAAHPAVRAALMDALPDEASYPVVIDPMGYVARSSTLQVWAGDSSGTNVPRRSLKAVFNSGGYDQAVSLHIASGLDGLGYTDDGQANQREMRYNWLWVIQRPTNRNQTTATMTVVVFDRRAHMYVPNGAEAVAPGVTSFAPGSTFISVNGAPDVKPGGWVMDATVGTGANTANGAARPRIRHANFYQVVSVTPNGATTILEVQTPIKTPTDNDKSPYNGTLTVLRGVSGVYVRPPLNSGE